MFVVLETSVRLYVLSSSSSSSSSFSFSEEEEDASSLGSVGGGGSAGDGGKWRLLKLSRLPSLLDSLLDVLSNVPLAISEDAHVYDERQVDALLYDLHAANGGTAATAPTLEGARRRYEAGDNDAAPASASGAGLASMWRDVRGAAQTSGGITGVRIVCVAAAFLGAVRFTAGDYLLMVTRTRRLGTLLGHAVYGISSTRLVPVQRGRGIAYDSSIERRYRRLFASGVDLTRGFFFGSTAHLHENVQASARGGSCGPDADMFLWNAYFRNRLAPAGCTCAAERDAVRARWCVSLVHGAFKHVPLSVFGRNVDVTLICRRSRHFAGTRYLKRGVSESGYVANEVETEQVVEADGGYASGGATRRLVSAHVQVRGSIPLHWSQEASALSPKPDIVLHRNDPLFVATGLHMRRLVTRYGNPVACLNLIKAVERKPREMILRRELQAAIYQLNEQMDFPDGGGGGGTEGGGEGEGEIVACESQGTPSPVAASNPNPNPNPNHTLYYHFDMAAKSRECGQSGLLEAFTPVARMSVELTGCFGPLEGNPGGAVSTGGDAFTWQHGVVRTNCVDCLDRTNVAQFAIGLMALSQQLRAVDLLGADDAPYAASTISVQRAATFTAVVGSPRDQQQKQLEDEIRPNSFTDATNIEKGSLPTIASVLMEMYEEIGDEIAQQYGGSSAHSVFFQNQKGMGATSSQGRDLLTSARRFYSNSFTDDEKQDAINLFLGTFRAPKVTLISDDGVPVPARMQHIWDLESDIHLHGSFGPSVTAAGIAQQEKMRVLAEIGEEQAEEEGLLSMDTDIALWDESLLLQTPPPPPTPSPLRFGVECIVDDRRGARIFPNSPLDRRTSTGSTSLGESPPSPSPRAPPPASLYAGFFACDDDTFQGQFFPHVQSDSDSDVSVHEDDEW